MSRSTQTHNRAAAAAFDFDVVTDVPPRPARKPQAAPATELRGDSGAARDTPKPAEA